MRALGCRFALDDFGTGFSSFAYLRSLDVDYIKIDGSFVRDLEGSPMSGSVVRSITDIAHVLNKRTIAETAETESICDALRTLGSSEERRVGNECVSTCRSRRSPCH